MGRSSKHVQDIYDLAFWIPLRSQVTSVGHMLDVSWCYVPVSPQIQRYSRYYSEVSA